jgi:hypothetical protein
MGLSLRRALDTPDAELEAVFGEGVLEERDRIVQAIRASLEAEGIEIGSGRRSDDDDEEGGERTESRDGEVVTAQPSAADTQPEEPVAATISAATVDKFANVPTQPVDRPKRTRKSAEPRVAAEGSEGLSAIELAFAMAGANLDLDDDDEAEDDAGDESPAEGEGREG